MQRWLCPIHNGTLKSSVHLFKYELDIIDYDFSITFFYKSDLRNSSAEKTYENYNN